MSEAKLESKLEEMDLLNFLVRTQKVEVLEREAEILRLRLANIQVALESAKQETRIFVDQISEKYDLGQGDSISTLDGQIVREEKPKEK